ncbi:MAG: hypothetical protein R3C61_15560 [Bacteroidia bacterium]
MDNLEYHYTAGTNQLTHVLEQDGPTLSSQYDDDLAGRGQSRLTPTYDAIGQLVSDDSGKIANIIWDAYHKIRESQMIIWLYLSPASGEPTHIWFEYDGLGNRVSKEVERNLNNAEFFHDVRTGRDLSLPRPVPSGMPPAISFPPIRRRIRSATP